MTEPPQTSQGLPSKWTASRVGWSVFQVALVVVVAFAVAGPDGMSLVSRFIAIAIGILVAAAIAWICKAAFERLRDRSAS